MKKKIHLVCNAHLDPVWQWQWEEGLAETLSTFRIAAAFCEKHDHFVFNHNEALLYQWVEEHDPDLFRRIQKLVKKKKWHIAGGSYLQPDLNAPGGESHIRQFLYGKTYFKEKFGAVPTTAYNFDPFGQPEGYQQILLGCGFDSYIFCRPDYGNWDLPVGTFWWQGRSGAKILARRSDDMYLSNGRIDEKLQKWLGHYKNEKESLILWGIGNHGGGISEQEYKKLLAFEKAHKNEYECIHSTPEAFFKSVKKAANGLKTVTGEFQNILPGCYTSMSRLKHAHRRTESLMRTVENLAALAWWQGRQRYPQKKLKRAWEDLMFVQFHDILPGSGIAAVERDAFLRLYHCQEELRRLRSRLFINMFREMPPAKEEVSIFFWNPHSFPVSTDVECEYQMSGIGGRAAGTSEVVIRCDGNPITAQREKEDANLNTDWRVRLALPLVLEPYGFFRADATFNVRKKARGWKNPPLSAERLHFKSNTLDIVINSRTGLVARAAPASSEHSYWGPNALQPVVFADRDHSWTSGDPDRLQPGAKADGGWNEPVGRFELATTEQMQDLFASARQRQNSTPSAQPPLAIIEDGAVRTVVEAVFVYHRSYIVRRYYFSKQQSFFEFRDRVFWNEKDTMLKVAIPLNFTADYTLCQTPYSSIKRPINDALHVERSNQSWVTASEKGAKGKYIGLVNKGSYAHSLYQNTLYVNVLRSPAFTSFDLDKQMDRYQKRFIPRQDQGEHLQVAFGCVFDKKPETADMERLAAQFNMPPQVFVYYPHGKDQKSGTGLPESFLQVMPKTVNVVALKKAEKGKYLIVRLQETAGEKTTAVLRLRPLDKKIEIDMQARTLQTLKIHRKTGRVESVNLIEDKEK